MTVMLEVLYVASFGVLVWAEVNTDPCDAMGLVSCALTVT